MPNVRGLRPLFIGKHLPTPFETNAQSGYVVCDDVAPDFFEERLLVPSKNSSQEVIWALEHRGAQTQRWVRRLVVLSDVLQGLLPSAGCPHYEGYARPVATIAAFRSLCVIKTVSARKISNLKATIPPLKSVM